ncbi:hypothetical protein FOA52_012212 [Chlamydomonas sp. UWO 241]|nr:hypothetical protein FOA52_012212 [Chlamydomonas sp. UWO 241]
MEGLKEGWYMIPAPHAAAHLHLPPGARLYSVEQRTREAAPPTPPPSAVGSAKPAPGVCGQPTPTAGGQQPAATAEGTDASSSAFAESLWSPPNALSLVRGASGPVIAICILQEQWMVAGVATAVSGATDWLDGYLARRMGLQSVIGSYLDPLGDKLLICSVVAALSAKGLIPLWVAAVVITRDAGLVVGAVAHRAHMLRAAGRPLRASELFSVGATAPPSAASSGCDENGAVPGAAAAPPHLPPMPPMPLMRPLLVSKANTVLQLALVCGCLSSAAVGAPEQGVLTALEVATAATTLASLGAYAHKYAAGKLL